MFVVLYRWRIKPEREQEFIDFWSEITAFYRENFGSLGSRLHRGSDGLFYSYAQWKSAEQRQTAFNSQTNLAAVAKMRAAIEESFPEMELAVVSDYLISP